MIKILFICHGNICRSPMAEYIFLDMLKKAGKTALFEVSSAAVSREEQGNDMYLPAKRMLQKHEIPYSAHRAHQVTEKEIKRSDIILAMDSSNVRNLRFKYGALCRDKVHLLLEYAGELRDVEDPWYTDDFETAFRDIEAGCRGLLKELTEEEI